MFMFVLYNLLAIAIRMSFVSDIIGSIVSIVVMYLYIKILYKINVECGRVVSEFSFTSREVSAKSNTTTVDISTVSTHETADSVPAQSPMEGDEGSTSTKQTYAESNVTLAKTQVKLVKNITKNTLLGLVGLSTTIMMNIKISIDFIVNAKADATLWRCMWCFDGAVNIIVMYLIFGCTAAHYNKICFYCHKGIQKCCIKATKVSIARNNTETEMAEYMG